MNEVAPVPPKATLMVEPCQIPVAMIPFWSMAKTVEVAKAAVEEETRNNGTAPPAIPAKENLAEGEEVPTPTFPIAVTVSVEVACQADPW